MKSEIEFLGMIVGNNEIKVDDRKIEAIRELPKSKTITDVRSFLELAQFFRRFVSEFSRVAYPLTNLTKKNNSISNWDAKCQHAFQELKLAFINSPVLRSPDWKKPSIGPVDALQNVAQLVSLVYDRWSERTLGVLISDDP